MTLTIDGHAVSWEGRMTLLELGRVNGIDIPALCDHPILEPYAACRLCLVEVEGRKGFVPACHTIAEDGMVVRTSTPELQALRRGILELILAEHPHACLICAEKSSCDEFKSTIRKTGEVTGCVLCPANGRCELQRVAAAVGLDFVPYPFRRREGEVRRDDPFIDRDNSLCILCGRCVRVCREVRGASVLTFVARGSATVVGTALGRSLVDSGCQFCGACVDVCPTGSLVERGARYAPLPDAEKRVLCPLCGQGCALVLTLKEGRVLSSRPDPGDPVNRGQACVRGRFLVRTVVESGRLLRPLVRKNGVLEAVSWDEALEAAASKLAAFGPDRRVVWATAQSSCEDLLALHRLAAALGAPDLAGTWGSSAAGLMRRLGRAAGFVARLNFRFPEIGDSGAALLFGDDPRITQPLVGIEVHRTVGRGGRFWRVTTGPEPMIGPGPEIRVLAGRQALFAEALEALFLKSAPGHVRKARGLKAFSSRLESLDLAKAARSLGLSKKDLQAMARGLAGTPSPVLLVDPGFLANGEGAAIMAALWNLATLLGGRLIPLDVENNVRGGLEIEEALSGRRTQGPGKRPDREVRPGSHVVYAVGRPPGAKVEGSGILILQTSHMTEEGRKADILLPEATSFEAEGTFVNIEGRIRVTAPAVEPAGDARPGWWIVGRLAEKLGLGRFGYETAADVRAELISVVPAFREMGAGGPCVFLIEEESGGPVFIDSAAAQQASHGWRAQPVTDPDVYKGLDLALASKGLKLVRGRK